MTLSSILAIPIYFVYLFMTTRRSLPCVPVKKVNYCLFKSNLLWGSKKIFRFWLKCVSPFIPQIIPISEAEDQRVLEVHDPTKSWKNCSSNKLFWELNPIYSMLYEEKILKVSLAIWFPLHSWNKIFVSKMIVIFEIKAFCWNLSIIRKFSLKYSAEKILVLIQSLLNIQYY